MQIKKGNLVTWGDKKYIAHSLTTIGRSLYVFHCNCDNDGIKLPGGQMFKFHLKKEKCPTLNKTTGKATNVK